MKHVAISRNNLSEKSEKTSITKTIEKNGYTKRISVREVENGFVVDLYKSWDDPEKGYQSEDKTFISKTNPLEKTQTEDSEENFNPEEFANILNSLL